MPATPLAVCGNRELEEREEAGIMIQIMVPGFAASDHTASPTKIVDTGCARV